MRRLAVSLALLLTGIVTAAEPAGIATVRDMRLQGDLQNAITVATKQLVSAGPLAAFELHLELARIHDRIGLHADTRPVAAAMQQLDLAAPIAEQLDAAAKAELELAYAELYYRAEMSDQLFTAATRYANAAQRRFVELEDLRGQADAVHRLGLIAMQRRELGQAHELFDESLRLDVAGGARTLFRGEYERHVGFVYALQNDYASALPHFERSLEARIEGGAIDASMFAAISLAATLVELDRSDDALPHLDYAMHIAERIPSQSGRNRIDAIRARIN